MRSAAERICGPIPVVDLTRRILAADCRDEAIASARAEVELALAAARPRQSLALRAR